jgi:putative nucleotidyltransferase with HDIG domain
MKVLLQGEIEGMPLPDLFQWIEISRKTCVLNIACEGFAATFYLEKGKIIYASSGDRSFRLGEFMVRNGVLDASQLLHALTESRRSGVLLTRFLIDGKYLSVDALTEVFSRLVVSLLLKIIQFKTGVFSVTSPIPDYAANGPIRLDIGGMIFDSVRQFDERTKERRDAFKSLEKINERLETDDFQLPVLPHVIMRLLSVIEDENSTFQQIARVIMSDQVLISRILKVANSAAYSSGGQIDSIHMAIARMGMRAILNITSAIKMNEMDFANVPRKRLQAILDDALKTAFLASGLARQCRVDPEEAFLGGLLHDLGKTVIISLAHDTKIDSALLDEFINERHAEIGALIARKWNYPESIQKLILYHHDCMYSGELNPVVAMVQLADGIIQAGPEGGGDAELLGSLGLQKEPVQDVYAQTMEVFYGIKNG